MRFREISELAGMLGLIVLAVYLYNKATGRTD